MFIVYLINYSFIIDTAPTEEAENLRKELQNMTEIGNHPNIIQIYGSGYIHIKITKRSVHEHISKLHYNYDYISI